MSKDKHKYKIELIRHKPKTEKETCLCCGRVFELQPFNFCIEGFYQGRKPAFVCVGCITDWKKRQILEDEKYCLPNHSDVLAALKRKDN